MLFAARFTEVNAAGQFPQEEDIDPFNDVPFQRRGIDEAIMRFDRPQIGEQLQFFS